MGVAISARPSGQAGGRAGWISCKSLSAAPDLIRSHSNPPLAAMAEHIPFGASFDTFTRAGFSAS